MVDSISGTTRGRKRALVIDDDPDTITLIAAVLCQNDFDVYPARDGPEGLQRLAEVEPDVVILDVMLPGIDGWTVLRRVRTISNVPVVMLSGLDDASSRQRGRTLGAADYIMKPFYFQNLATRVLAVAAGECFIEQVSKVSGVGINDSKSGISGQFTGLGTYAGVPGQRQARVDLPARPGEPAPRILVVDDEEAMTSLLELGLRKAGF